MGFCGTRDVTRTNDIFLTPEKSAPKNFYPTILGRGLHSSQYSQKNPTSPHPASIEDRSIEDS